MRRCPLVLDGPFLVDVSAHGVQPVAHALQLVAQRLKLRFERLHRRHNAPDACLFIAEIRRVDDGYVRWSSGRPVCGRRGVGRRSRLRVGQDGKCRKHDRGNTDTKYFHLFCSSCVLVDSPGIR